MGKIFKDATPEEEKAFIEERRQFAFLAACRWPISWIGAAERHKRAADALYEIAHKGNERTLERSLKEFRERIKKGKTRSESRVLEGKELSDFLDSELFGDYMLLSGYALECVLKGLLLARNPDLVQDEKKLDTSITTHNLPQLFNNCEIELSEQERQVTDVMTWHIEWGKYPAPKDLKDMPSPVEPRQIGIKAKGGVFHESQVQNVVNGLYDRVCALFESIRSADK